MTLDEIYLEARNPDRNVMRAYRITLSRDLFGAYLVECRFGRIGCYGQGSIQSFDDEGAARAHIEKTLRRRVSAPRRVGVPYVATTT
jgi:predicted DNA-binding WGR domain protein